jgi:imidazolonepropionase-like amidohydrolase
MVTVNPAMALGQERVIGRIRTGFRADLIAVPCNHPDNLLEEIVAFGRYPEWLMVNGNATDMIC